MSPAQTNPGSDAKPADAVDTGTAWLDDLPAWAISLLFHGAIAVGLMSISWTIVAESELVLTSEARIEPTPLEEFVIDTEISDDVGSNSHVDLTGPSLATAQLLGPDTHYDALERIEEQINPPVPTVMMVAVPSEAELLETVDLMGTTEHAGGTREAIDRITWEISASLRERRTLVVWLFDQSLSLERRRNTIADRFANIYKQLSKMNLNTEVMLSTGIVGFGQTVNMLQGRPGTDIEQLTRKIREMQNDASGKELVFTAVDRAVRTFLPEKKKQRANMMLIVVTDERGDDFLEVESVTRKCTRSGIRVYCVGNSAVFGREKGYVRYAWEAEGSRFEEYLPVEQGPETLRMEGVQLPFWTAGGLNLDRMSSGFGPYALSRLCAETGGIYFIADQTAGPTFDPTVMRQYSPDYRPIKEYVDELSKNKAKGALIAAAQKAVPEDMIPRPQRRFLASNDNVLRQQITNAQRPLATLDYYLEELHQILQRGERYRDSLDSDRWRASYDLAMGRVLAMRVRAFGYNSMLAEMKVKPRTFASEDYNLWILRPSDEINAGTKVRGMHDEAMDYLSRVIDQHPSTPWARLAKVELEEPLGWEWHEGYVPVQPDNPNQNTNQPRFAPEDMERQRQQQRRQRVREATRPLL